MRQDNSPAGATQSKLERCGHGFVAMSMWLGYGYVAWLWLCGLAKAMWLGYGYVAWLWLCGPAIGKAGALRLALKARG